MSNGKYIRVKNMEALANACIASHLAEAIATAKNIPTLDDKEVFTRACVGACTHLTEFMRSNPQLRDSFLER